MFNSEATLKSLVENWSNCTLPEAEWTHAAHIATCSYVAWNNTLPRTYSLMRDGLFRFNQATGTPNSDTRGYHETLTRFWCTLLFFSIHKGHFHSCLDAANAMIAEYGINSRAHRDYYSFDVFKSVEARRGWIAPDKSAAIEKEAFCW